MKSIKYTINYLVSFLSFYLMLFIIINLLIFTFGLFYYLDFNVVNWGAKTRGSISIINLIMLLMSYVSFEVNKKDLM